MEECRMATQAIRKRLSINKYQGREENMENTSSMPDPLREPLLLNDQVNVNDPIPRPNSWDDKRNVLCHGICHLSQFIKYSARRIANLFVSIGSFLRRLFAFNFTIQGLNNKAEHSLLISPLQEERLQNLRHRLEVPFDASLVEHQDALRQLWRLAYPEREIPSLKSELWKEMGWQGVDPSTDIRGGGFISVENLIYFVRTYPICVSRKNVSSEARSEKAVGLQGLGPLESFQRLLHKQDGVRSKWEYPFAAAGINISFNLAQILGLHSGHPITKAGIHFLKLLGGDEMAFDRLYCVAFQLLDSKWLSKRATYMEFNEVMKSTRLQLEQELGMNEIFTISDMPTFKMLK